MNSEANFTPRSADDLTLTLCLERIGDQSPCRADAVSDRLLGRVAIVGVGLMGGSIGLAVKAANAASEVVGVGRSSEKLALAQRLGAIDSWQTNQAAGVADADLVILCTTIGHITEHLPGILKAAGPDAVVTDIGSTKAMIVAAASGDPRFIGGHPMCGSERTGVEEATVSLYAGATWASTPTSQTGAAAVQSLSRLIAATGARELFLDPAVHDSMVAVTSHVPHVLASALMRQAAALRESIPALPRMSAGAFADMTRIAASSPSIWRDVCLTNRTAVLETLQAYRRELDILEEALQMQDAVAIEEFFASGQAAKRDWPPRNGV